MSVANQFRTISGAFLDVFYPNICQICNTDLNMNEQHVCLSCAYDLPYIGQNKKELQKLEKLFWGRVEVQRIYSLLNYQRGNQTQRLLHLLKYKEKKKLGQYFGEVLAEVITEPDKIHAILPVPLHPKKQRLRGFNQSRVIADGIANKTNIPINETCLIRNAHNLSQTKFSKYDRWDNVRQIFSVKQSKQLENKHVLLVDDVLTTGATIEACILALLKVENCTVSVATLAARV
ncbi:MAG: ComF family protein [Crocinitomix sp.]|nr:ComF family protein [Crocinitomix sp.]